MDNFYVTLPSDSSGYYYPANTIANFTTKLATPLELKPNTWEVGLVEISYPKVYKKRFQHNTLRYDSEQIEFPVKHYETLYDLLTNLPQFFESSKKENFLKIFSEYINTYQEPDKQLLNLCYGENSISIGNNLISHFPACVYNGLEDLAQTIMKPANFCTSKITVSLTDNPNFTEPEPV